MAKRFFLSAICLTSAGLTLLGQTFQNSDSCLTNGSSTSFIYPALGSLDGAQIESKNNPQETLWYMGSDPYALTQGSGQIGFVYNGMGTAQWSISLTNLNVSQVNAFPFICFGHDVWGYVNGTQGLPFPVALTNLNALTTEVQYNLAGQYGTNMDVLLDLWLAPAANYSAGSAGAVEIEILPYITYPGYWGSYVKTILLPCILDGQPTNLFLLEYDAARAGSGGGQGGGTTILFYPSGPGVTSGDLQFDAAVLIKEAAATAAVETWYLPGYNIGTEFGLASSANFTFTLNKFRLQMSTGARQTVPTIVAASVSSGTINLPFSTRIGFTYTVQYKTNLTDAAWQTLSTNNGNGSIQIATDPVSHNCRFYRLSVQ